MLDYTKELTIHIQGLSIYFHQAFEEVDKHIDVDIPSDTQVHSAYIKKIGGYKPNLVRIIYKSKEGNELQQAYMAKHIDGNLICIPVEEIPIVNPFSLDRTLPNSPYGIILYLPSSEVNEKGWLGLYQGGIPWTTRTYKKLELSEGITYLET